MPCPSHRNSSVVNYPSFRSRRVAVRTARFAGPKSYLYPRGARGEGDMFYPGIQTFRGASEEISDLGERPIARCDASPAARD